MLEQVLKLRGFFVVVCLSVLDMYPEGGIENYDVTKMK
jgi:hypothetical protein